jgi:CRISPR-associated protein Cas5a/b/c
MIGFIADYEFSWGFQARITGLSKTSPSFYYPPPTTFLGALAETVAKDFIIPESNGRNLMAMISDNLLAIGFRPLNCIPIKYSDINRILSIRRSGEAGLCPNPQDLNRSFDSPARGKTILCSIDGEAPKMRWFLVFKDDSFDLDGKRVKIDESNFWKIHRLGSKESVVSAVNVEKLAVQQISGLVYTKYCYPIEGVKEIDRRGRWEFEVYINPYEPSLPDLLSNYFSGKKATPFRIPILKGQKPESEIELLDCVAYKANEEVVVGCRK